MASATLMLCGRDGHLLAMGELHRAGRYERRADGQLALPPIAVDPETDRLAWGATAKLAARHRLTLYDAAYLELARSRCLPLATLDGELRVAATAEDVCLLGLRE